MTNFFIKAGFLIIIVLFINLLIRNSIPYFWSMDTLLSYEKVLETYYKDTNLLFLGTSRTANGIQPSWLDNQLNKYHNLNINSYNLGIPGASIGENCALAREYLYNEKLPKLKYIVIELTSVENALSGQFCGPKVLHSARTTYWLDSKGLLFSINNLFGQAQIYTKQKIKLTYNYITSYLINMLNIGMLDDFFKLKALGISENSFGKGHKHSRGYRDVEKEPSKEMSRRKKEHLNTKGKRSNQKAKNSILFFNGKANAKKLKNKAFLKGLKQLIEEGEKRNIKIIYLVPPLIRLKSYEHLSSVYKALPLTNKVQLTNANVFPELYEYTNIFDGTHFTKDGAHIYTKYLANELTKKLLR